MTAAVRGYSFVSGSSGCALAVVVSAVRRCDAAIIASQDTTAIRSTGTLALEISSAMVSSVPGEPTVQAYEVYIYESCRHRRPHVFPPPLVFPTTAVADSERRTIYTSQGDTDAAACYATVPLSRRFFHVNCCCCCAFLSAPMPDPDWVATAESVESLVPGEREKSGESYYERQSPQVT